MKSKKREIDSGHRAVCTIMSAPALRVAAILAGAGGVVLGLWLAGTGCLQRFAWYPHCLFHQLTGGWCVTCGGTRALQSLFAGDVAEALRCNAALVLVLIPLFLYTVAIACRCAWHGHSVGYFRINGRFITFLVLFLILFTVARNLPGLPGELLAPPNGTVLD